MLDRMLTGEKDERLQLFRQLYERCREQHDDTGEQTRLLLELISQEQPPTRSSHRRSGF